VRTQQTVEITRCFGGGYELTVDGYYIGIFPTHAARRAHSCRPTTRPRALTVVW
jgi:hypothetical protein